MEDQMYAEGELAKRFRLYQQDIEGKPVSPPDGEYDTPAEALAHINRRLDRRYLVSGIGPKLATAPEFRKWISEQETRQKSAEATAPHEKQG